ncbi:hypothetical protein KHA80_02460 [Anaerobacillus sp. HL2]|nr:hypothetical protein KHA80_02460 [Anaerobacillus sp. HL2]
MDAANKSVSITIANGSTSDANTATAIIAALNAYQADTGTSGLNWFSIWWRSDRNKQSVATNSASYNNLSCNNDG